MGLADTVSSSNGFPVFRLCHSTLLRQLPSGTRTVSPVARHVLVTVLSLPPRRSVHVASVSPRHVMLPSPRSRGLGLRILVFFRGHFWVHLRYGPATRSPSLEMALSVGFIRFVSSADATQAKGLLTFTPVGLPPTEHASLFLDALLRKNPCDAMQPHNPACIHDEAHPRQESI